MTITARECLDELLGQYAPERVLVIGDPPQVLPPLAPQSLAPLIEVEFSLVAADEAAAELVTLGRFDFAVLSELLELLNAADAQYVLGRLKNLHTDRFLLLVDPARSCLSHDELLALALAPFEHIDDGRVAWRYDIDLYNPERRWNNPEDWANPENFEKFRW